MYEILETTVSTSELSIVIDTGKNPSEIFVKIAIKIIIDMSIHINQVFRL